jgi:hypothetical protein
MACRPFPKDKRNNRQSRDRVRPCHVPAASPAKEIKESHLHSRLCGVCSEGCLLRKSSVAFSCTQVRAVVVLTGASAHNHPDSRLLSADLLQGRHPDHDQNLHLPRMYAIHAGAEKIRNPEGAQRGLEMLINSLQRLRVLMRHSRYAHDIGKEERP